MGDNLDTSVELPLPKGEGTDRGDAEPEHTSVELPLPKGEETDWGDAEPENTSVELPLPEGEGWGEGLLIYTLTLANVDSCRA